MLTTDRITQLPPTSRRVVYVEVSWEFIEYFLKPHLLCAKISDDIPLDATFLGIQLDVDRRTLLCAFEHDSFPVVSEAHVPQHITPAITAYRCQDECQSCSQLLSLA